MAKVFAWKKSANSAVLYVGNGRAPKVRALTAPALGLLYNAASRGSQRDGDTISIDESGLSNVTARQWRVSSDAVSFSDIAGQTGSTYVVDDATDSVEGNYISCRITSAEGVTDTPPLYIAPPFDIASHNTMQDNAIGILRHNDCDFIAVANGSWTTGTTWLNGVAPTAGAKALIPAGKTVTMDLNDGSRRLDRIRVDGSLIWDHTTTTNMLVETIIGTEESTIQIGSVANPITRANPATITFSDRHYPTNSAAATDLDLATSDPELVSRGMITMGKITVVGEKTTTEAEALQVASGETSILFTESPVNLLPDDEIIIGGTIASIAAKANIVKQDEIRTVTSVVGPLVNFTPALTYNHTNQVAGSLERSDLLVDVLARNNKPILFQSESATPNYHRAHTMQMHGRSQVFMKNASFMSMGRTDKRIFGGRIKQDPSDSIMKFYVTNGSTLVYETLTAQVNLISRYPVHAHFAGFPDDPQDAAFYEDLYVEDVPGHAIVHHGCRANMYKCGMYDFAGGGMISEAGNEIGFWADNLAMGSRADLGAGNEIANNPKKIELDATALKGDRFRAGYGFGMHSRAMNVNNNRAVSCVGGHFFFHRGTTDTDESISPSIPHIRANGLDLQRIANATNAGAEEFDFVDYPIRGFEKNRATACIHGLFVSKETWPQWHDVNVHIRDFTAWGCDVTPVMIEYVGNYLLERIDVIGGVWGIRFGGNTYQVGAKNCRIDGCGTGLNFNYVTDSAGVNALHNNTNDPRGYAVAVDIFNCGTDILYGLPLEHPQATRIEDDWDGTTFNRDATPTENYPLTVATITGSFNVNDVANINNLGDKTDVLGTQKLIPKTFADRPVIGGGGPVGKASFWNGHYSYLGNDVIPSWALISDRLSTRPHKFLKLATADYSLPNGPGDERDKGVLPYSTTPVTAGGDKLATVTVNGSTSIDIVAGSSHATGTPVLDVFDYLSPRHGTITLDAGTGEVVYSPSLDYEGPDEWYNFVEVDNQFDTVRANVLVGGNATAPSALTVDTHFAASDGGSSINVELLERPDTGKRNIIAVYYTTDGGTTRRRLCNLYGLGVYNITLESDGVTAIGTGSYDVQLQFDYDYDDGTTSWSAVDAVTVA